MSAEYEIWLTTDKGVRLAPLNDVVWMQASRTANRIGYLSGRWPWTLDDNLIKPDHMVQVWRAPAGGRLKLWRPYLIRRWRFETGSQGDQFVYIGGRDPNELLRRRIVAHYANETNATASAEEADDLMKRIVTDSIADGSNPSVDAGTRVWGDLSIAGDLTDGPQITKDFAWTKLLTRSGMGILPAIADASREAGTEVWFDVAVNSVSATSITFQFRTFTDQPGQDMTSKARFDEARGNLMQPALEYDHSEEENYIYAGGQGVEDDREIQQVYDADLYNVSQWNRCEAFEYATSQSAANGVREAGRARLREGRPVKRFEGEPVDTEATRFGLHWDFGDKVRARYRNEEFDAIVKNVVLHLSRGVETISARMEYES